MDDVARHELSIVRGAKTKLPRPDFLSNENHSQPPRSIPEPPVRHEPLGQVQGKKKDATRFRVSITSFRLALLDPDNVCPKYFVDCLRYAEIIPNDTTRDIELVVRQETVQKKKEERTEITIEPIWEPYPSSGALSRVVPTPPVEHSSAPSFPLTS